MQRRTPPWFWFTFLPVLGGLGIVYAGNKVNRYSWLCTGLFVTTVGVILYSSHLLGFVWLSQIIIAFFLKADYLQAIEQQSKLANSQEKALLPKAVAKVDINNCTKDDLVYGLGLPIVYANEVESARNEGYQFTHLEELMEIAGIPESYQQTLDSLVVFSYYANIEADFSWRRCNSLSEQELINCNLESEVASLIVQERSSQGIYRSFPDLRKRTGLPLEKLQPLL